MPAKIINLCVPSYPLIGFGLFEPLKIAGGNYGNITYHSFITYPHQSEPRDARLEVNLHGYLAKDNALTVGVASALNMGVGLCNFVVGFGLVKWKTEQPNPKSPYGNNNLIFIMNHTDFNPSDKTHQTFGC
ncbi:hypothetical protein PCANC_25249 [Puccinia coronata f. sp. avenae]|uniref:Uncharacterized protein n=1 Tax=Puccinia coronata f. sp. avenae TaxID=200324 RepID=A0A2N5S7T9_9BASI|nr:hypothetical protein PCANC_25249 [Puccinia coronata f. sp. avenae]